MAAAAAQLVLRGWGFCSRPLLDLVLSLRYLVGKEDVWSLRERRFLSPRPRPSDWGGKQVVWFHAASLGECISLLPLVRALLAESADRRALVTTGTVTAHRWCSDVLARGHVDGLDSARVAVSLAPCDARRAVDSFLDTWAPSCGVFVESELWPVLIGTCTQRDVPLALVSARLSARSYALWSLPGLRSVARALVGNFRVVVPQCAVQRARFAALGAMLPTGAGIANLKWCDPGLRPPAPALEAALRASVLRGSRPAWAALSTHDGEDELVARAHAQLLAADRTGSSERPLLVAIPRHANDPRRIGRALAAYKRRGLSVALHSEVSRALADVGGAGGGASVATFEPDVYLCDAIGQVQIFLRACPLVLVCGSLVPGPGGHNPLEPMRAGCATLIGPHAQNVASTIEAVERDARDGCALQQLRGADDLSAALELLRASGAAELRRRREAASRSARQLEATELATTVAAVTHAILSRPMRPGRLQAKAEPSL
jgi:3-deoxy-D-manno-octulosonic-acid transferase